MNIGTRIALVRRAQRITQRELAYMCLLSAQALSNIETGHTEPDDSPATAGHIADIKTALRWTPKVDAALDALEAALP